NLFRPYHRGRKLPEILLVLRENFGQSQSSSVIPAHAVNAAPAGWSLGWVPAVDSQGRTIWIVDAHREGMRFVVRADEKLTALEELERAIYEFAGGWNPVRLHIP